MMKHVICLLSLILIPAFITIVSINYNWSPITYMLTSIGVGGILGYVSAKGGYEI